MAGYTIHGTRTNSTVNGVSNIKASVLGYCSAIHYSFLLAHCSLAHGFESHCRKTTFEGKVP